jgi:Holliday junction DNA helicase RuvB
MSEPTTIHDAAPSVIDKVVGQKQAVDLLKVALSAYWNDRAAGRNPTFGHTLMVGPPGVGKTLISRVLASELGGNLKECLGQHFGTFEDANIVLLEATDETVLFIDEAHLLGEYAQTLLLKACDERTLQISKTPLSRKLITVPLSKFTLVLATTDEASLFAPLRDRMKLTLRFDFYSNSELAELCRQRAQALRWQSEAEIFGLIASRSKSTPRLAIRLLESCYRTARSEGSEIITVAHLDRTTELEGLAGTLGLDKSEQTYLRVLAEAAGSPVRLNVLATRLGLPTKTISTVIERFLVREGLVERSDSGRSLTEKGNQYVRQLHVR